MLKRILGLIFGDFGLVVQAALTSVVSWFVFPTFLQVLNTNHIFTTFVSILVGILAVGFSIVNFNLFDHFYTINN